jgi:hypothetical protein
MNASAFTALGLAFWAIVLLALTYKLHFAARPIAPPRDPPYR